MVNRTPPSNKMDDFDTRLVKLEKSARLWAELSKVLRVISSTLETDQVLDHILKQAVQVLGAEGGSLILVEPKSKELVFHSAIGPIAEDLLGTRMPWGQGLVGEAAATGRALIVNDTAADPRWFSGYDEATNFVTQSILCVPMISRKQVMGVLEIVNKQDGSFFDASEEELLQALASHAAAALTNAKLYTATRRQAEEVSALLETAQAANSTLNLDKRLEIIALRAQELVEADGCVILHLDQESGVLTPIIAKGNDEKETMQITLKMGEGISGQVAQSGHGRIVNHAHQDPAAITIPGTTAEPECLLAVPLCVKGTTIGVMTVTRFGAREFIPHDLELISSLANHVAVAIENARLYNASRQRNKELSVLYDIAISIGQTLDMPQLLSKILHRVPEILNQAGGAIYLYSENRARLELVHHEQIAPNVLDLLNGSHWAQNAINKTAHTSQVVDDPFPAAQDQVPSERSGGEPYPAVRRLVCTPLVSHRRVRGVLIIPAYSADPLNSAEKRLLETLGRQIGMAVENAFLYAQLHERAETLQKAYDDLAEVDRLKDELVQNISHELRTPITFIKGYVSLLLDNDFGELTPDQIESLLIVNDKTEQLVELVNGILTLQTLSSKTLKVAPSSPTQLAAQAINEIKLAAEERQILIVTDYPEELLPIVVDPARILQVFDNLLQNAIKFSPPHSTVVVKMQASDDTLDISIIDNGIGIPADKIDRVFDRFFQVDGSMTRRFGGAGLGLAICKQIVEAHEGEISVKSQEAVGTTFTFSLPLALSSLRA